MEDLTQEVDINRCESDAVVERLMQEPTVGIQDRSTADRESPSEVQSTNIDGGKFGSSNVRSNSNLQGSTCESGKINADQEKESSSDDNFSEVDPNEYNSLLPSLLDSEVDTRYLDVAPGEGNFPKNVYFDTYGEELAFPCIYAGHKMEDIYPQNLKLSERLRWELRNRDRRGAGNDEKIFFYV